LIKEVVSSVKSLSDSAEGSNKKWVEVETRCVWFAVALSSGFLLTWTLTATHFIFLVLPGGVSRHWPSLFFNFSILCIPVGLFFNPLIHVYFDPYLQTLLWGLFEKAKVKGREGSDFVFRSSLRKHFASTALNGSGGKSSTAGRSSTARRSSKVSDVSSLVISDVSSVAMSELASATSVAETESPPDSEANRGV